MKKIEMIKEICSQLGMATNVSGPDHNRRYKIKETVEPDGWAPVAAELFWFRRRVIQAIYERLIPGQVNKEAPDARR